MSKRPGFLITAALGVVVAACSVAAPEAALPAPAAPHAPLAVSQDDLSRQEAAQRRAPAAASAPVAKSVPVDDYFYGTLRVNVTPATSASGGAFQSRRDGRAPSFAPRSGAPAEDYQSLHATYNHQAR
jgi:hypothetical protein